MTELTVVIPVYNEEKNIAELYRRLKPVLKSITSRYEIIFVNDGSTDQTPAKLQRLRAKDRLVKIISFSRNFGHMAAIAAGLLHSSGKRIVLMDADLQDPPEVIPQMWEKAKLGFEVVYGIKIRRKEGLIRRLMFSSFYKILDLVSPYKMPANVGTFSLMDQKVAKILASLPERNKYLSGLRAWTGFSQTGIVYERGHRFSGQPASLRRLVKLALDGLVSFSYIPLRLATILGFFCAIIAFISIMVVLLLRIFFNFGIVGWASTLSTVLLMGGIQLITLGILGEYLARIYDEVKNRPEFIITEKTGFKK